MIVIAGPNGSGKTSVTKKLLHHCKILSYLVDRLYVYDNSVDGVDASLQFRMNKGVVIKTYVAEVCPWAQDLLPSDK